MPNGWQGRLQPCLLMTPQRPPISLMPRPSCDRKRTNQLFDRRAFHRKPSSFQTTIGQGGLGLPNPPWRCSLRKGRTDLATG
jgi:hypothetical protein